MRLSRRIAVAFIAIALVELNAQEVTLSPATTDALERAISTFMSKYNVPGLSVAVISSGALSWSNGYGMADLENFVPAKAATVYRLASVSKPITATAVMKLYEEHKLDLDAPVQKYCPAFPPKPWPITTRQLLGHRGGIRHYKGDEWGSTRHYNNTAESLRIFSDDALEVQPGTGFTYTTYGYTLLGCVLEGASGQAYIDFVRQNILLPADMAHSGIDDLHKLIYNRAQGYQKDKSGQLLNSDLADTSYKIPGGGMVSTAEDLAHFAIALESDTLLKRETRELMWTPQKDAAGKENGYALGWEVSHDLGPRDVHHSGAQQRVSTAIILAPENRSAIVVLCNLEGVPAIDLARQLLGILNGVKSQATAK